MITADPISDQLRTRGQAEKRDRDALLLLALINWQDKARINSTWNRLAPRAYAGLTGAMADSPMTAPASQFWFNPATMQFGHGTRGYVPPTAIRTALNAFNAAAGAELASMTASAGHGEIAIPIWQDAMTRGVKDAQLVNAAVGRGGSAQLSDADLSTMIPTLAYQFGRLDRFAGQMEDGEAASTPEAAGARAANYAKAAIATFSDMRRVSADVAGMTMERNLLGNAEHCEFDPRRPQVPDCPSLTGLGWVSLGELPPIGMRACLWNCRCEIHFKR